MEQVKYKLSEILTIRNGKDYKTLQTGKIPVFGSGGYMCSVNEFLYDKPSVLLPRKGTLSNIQYYDKGPFWTVDTLFYSIVNEDKVEPYYLYCYLKKLDLSGLDTGASIPSMTQKTYNSIKVFLPELTVQRKIASILSSYDSLIEANTRRIRLLEQMAENLYKEWFVRFRFPGHEKVKMVDGLPEGWKYERLGDVISIVRGVSYSSEEIASVDGCNLINLKNIQGYGGFRLDGTKKYTGKYKKEQIVKARDLIMGVTDMTQDRRTVGAVALIPASETINVISADLVKIESSINSVYLYSMFRYGGVSLYISQFANGANVLHLKPQTILATKVFLANKELIDKFLSVVEPLLSEIQNLNRQSSLLSRQRDLLLPRLMSGKLEITL